MKTFYDYCELMESDLDEGLFSFVKGQGWNPQQSQIKPQQQPTPQTNSQIKLSNPQNVSVVVNDAMRQADKVIPGARPTFQRDPGLMNKFKAQLSSMIGGAMNGPGVRGAIADIDNIVKRAFAAAQGGGGMQYGMQRAYA